jgi:hypothetical protein
MVACGLLSGPSWTATRRVPCPKGRFPSHSPASSRPSHFSKPSAIGSMPPVSQLLPVGLATTLTQGDGVIFMEEEPGTTSGMEMSSGGLRAPSPYGGEMDAEGWICWTCHDHLHVLAGWLTGWRKRCSIAINHRNGK